MQTTSPVRTLSLKHQAYGETLVSVAASMATVLRKASAKQRKCGHGWAVRVLDDDGDVIAYREPGATRWAYGPGSSRAEILRQYR